MPLNRRQASCCRTRAETTAQSAEQCPYCSLCPVLFLSEGFDALPFGFPCLSCSGHPCGSSDFWGPGSPALCLIKLSCSAQGCDFAAVFLQVYEMVASFLCALHVAGLLTLTLRGRWLLVVLQPPACQAVPGCQTAACPCCLQHTSPGLPAYTQHTSGRVARAITAHWNIASPACCCHTVFGVARTAVTLDNPHQDYQHARCACDLGITRARSIDCEVMDKHEEDELMLPRQARGR